MNFKSIQNLIQSEMEDVNISIKNQLNSDIPLINELGFYIINSGGKRIRPLISILAAKALDVHSDKMIQSATIIEFIHTATLLHDDVVDESLMRRGKKTANAMFGNAASVLVGDFLHTRSFQMMAQLQNLQVIEAISNATNIIAEGEVLQLINCNDPKITEKIYMDVIYCKTAKLFEVAITLVGILGDQSKEIQTALTNYGKYLGTAFQLTDDVMDYCSDATQMGKNTGDDLGEGKPTLPLIYAIKNGTPDQSALIVDAITNGNGLEHFDAIMEILKETNAFGYTKERAIEEANKAVDALSVIPESTYKEALISLAYIAADRKK